jgi:hypothetical protein
MPKRCAWFVAKGEGAPGGRYAFNAKMPPAGVSGVYAIRDRWSHIALYVGESHTDNLRRTITRHFQTWNDAEQERAVYGRERAEVCWLQTAADAAIAKETEWLAFFEPRDNLVIAEYDDAELEYAPAGNGGVPF